jgi:hypothetical protein
MSLFGNRSLRYSKQKVRVYKRGGQRGLTSEVSCLVMCATPLSTMVKYFATLLFLLVESSNELFSILPSLGRFTVCPEKAKCMLSNCRTGHD